MRISSSGRRSSRMNHYGRRVKAFSVAVKGEFEGGGGRRREEDAVFDCPSGGIRSILMHISRYGPLGKLSSE